MPRLKLQSAKFQGFKFLRRFGLPERLLAILLLVAGIDFAANTVLFERASSFALRQDDAARIAEHLVIVSRAIERTPLTNRSAMARELSTPRFSIQWSSYTSRPSGSVGLDTLRTQILEVAPELDHTDVQLFLRPLAPKGNIGGSLILPDRSVLEFQTSASTAWTLNAGRIVTLMLPTLVLAVLAWILFRATLLPLRSLVKATRTVGSGPPEPVEERGPDEVRQLIRAFNLMQQRIHKSLVARTQSMLAIGHDLRTPLARLQLRLDNAPVDTDTRGEMTDDIDEMRHLLESLQAFVDAGGNNLPAVRIDLAAMAATLVDTAADQGGDATYLGADSLEVMARSVSIRRALSNLIENALHYAGNVRVSVRADGDTAEIVVEDDGPGIPDSRMDDVLQPFVRLDTARSRDTPGMGLGLPIVRRAAKLEGGTLQLLNRPEGGLRVIIRLPHAVARNA